MKRLGVLAGAFWALATAVAAPAKDVVAEGFATWEGIDEKNYIFGRRITPSDLRHRTVFVLHLDAKALHSQFLATGSFINGSLGFPAAHMVNWDTLEAFPRENIALAIVHGACDEKTYRDALRFPKDKEVTQEESSAMQAWSGSTFVAVYGDKAKLVGAEEPTAFPTAQVILPGEAQVAWTGKFAAGNAKAVKEVRGALAKGKAATATWRPLYGVAEVQHWKNAEKIIKDGKTGFGVKAAAILQKGIKDKNPEKAKEAQIMYDALVQYRDDMALRIAREAHATPARAFADMQILLAAFPVEKKNLKEVDARLKKNKTAAQLGKIFVDYLTWSQPDFVFKTASEAKTAKQKIAAWKKTLDLLAADEKNPQIQGEAALLGTLADSLAETIETKVPQK